jgi:serine/threonine protein kinase
MEVMNLGIVVGKGSFGVIYKAEWQGQVVAAKYLQVPEGLVDREQVEQGLRREVKVLSQLNHLNIVRFLGCHIAEMVIMTELCERGSLRCVLDDEGGSLTVARRFHFLKDIACGMNYLHNLAKPTLHHDLKPHNVLVASDWTAKVADFGLPPSSPRPWAELFDSAPFLQPADVYAFGVLAAETMHPDPRWRPWPAGTSEMKIVVEITR